jgi:hypothetical protein
VAPVKQSAIVIPVSTFRRTLVLALVVLVVVGLVLLARTPLFRAGVLSFFDPGAAEMIDHSAYQSVLLTNGATLFGRLQPQGDEWFLMTDVYYLTTTDQGTPQLIKRGNEAQGPKEPIIIPKQQIVYIENMRDDSDVVGLIKRFKSGQLPAATPPPATVAPTAAPTTARPSPTR